MMLPDVLKLLDFICFIEWRLASFCRDCFASIFSVGQDQKKPYALNKLKLYVFVKDMKQIVVEL